LVRRGRQSTVHWHAFKRYRKELRLHFDAVIDEVNTIPFLTPLWADVPTYMFIHQLAKEVWWYESRLPMSVLGFLAEPRYLRLYRNTPTFTVSESTKADLLELGFEAPITVIPTGLEPIANVDAPKAEVPTFIYVGRICPSKRVNHVIDAFAEFTANVGSGQLWLVGDGKPTYLSRLKKHVSRLGLTRQVTFLGRLAISEKHQRMARAHALIMASVREGWGLVVSEANACGTPAIVYDVPGLRDSVRNQETGLVVQPSPAALARGMIQLWRDPALYRHLAKEALAWSSMFSFDLTVKAVRQRLAQNLQTHVV